ncbi:hypothetical protein BDW02DRAFT_567546 [Decorospora gaudefroyi]|uniref:DUF2034 domain-containing protein n=1 Tax=Decorospora gaudefroyi TaxID=184978 RepID=A0A6A5KNJ5_9PLEO|nr:hypothetical protein BDW02DRAFT_567546 [Decorospora gaudefroyi]
MRPSLRPTWPKQRSLHAWLPRAPPHRVPRRIATTHAQNAAPVDMPKLVVSPGSAHHNSLLSFVEYAKRVNLASGNSVYVGTHYEYTSALALMRLGFSLLRIGRKDDAGIDLIGHWVLAPLREPLPVIIQCKARRMSVSPAHIRELEGAFRGIPPDWRNKDVLGLLVTTLKATKGVLEAVGMSRWPMGFVLVTKTGLVQQFLWNRAASERGLEGVGVTVRHTPRALLAELGEEETEEPSPKTPKKRLAKFKNAGTRKDIQLTWMGSPIFPDRETLDQETVQLMHRVSHAPGQGRAKGSKNKVVAEEIPPPKPQVPPTADTEPAPKRRGRPIGSKTKPRPIAVDEPRLRGRPKGTTTPFADKVPRPRGGQIPIPRALREHGGRKK